MLKLISQGDVIQFEHSETQAWADPMLKLISQGDVIQFERRGFYRVDVAFRPPICNNGKTTYPRLVYVPDGKPQHKVPFSRLPSAKNRTGKGLGSFFFG